VGTNRQLAVDASSFALVQANAGPRDLGAVALLVRWEAADPRIYKNMYMRGWPDSSAQWDDDGNPVFNAAFNNAWNPFRAWIVARPFYVRQFNTADGTNPKLNITSLETSATGQLTLNLAAADTSAVPGKRIKIQKYKGTLTSKVNGLVRVVSRPDDTTILTAKILTGLESQTSEGGGAYARLEKYEFTQLARGEKQRFTSHRTGRAFFVALGRQ